MGMGSSSSASNAATAADNARQAQIAGTVAQIQSAYGSPNRQSQVTDYTNNLQKYYDTQVNTQEAQNARNLKFANARSGLTGGSESTDSNAQLQKDYTTGLLQATQQAQAGGAALKQSDQNAENQMISLAQAGNFTGAIPQQISAAQNTSLAGAQNYGNANALGNLFQGTGQIYTNEQTAAANRLAQQTPFGTNYTTSAYGAGGGGSSGRPWG
jgi:hypothetical protein